MMSKSSSFFQVFLLDKSFSAMYNTKHFQNFYILVLSSTIKQQRKTHNQTQNKQTKIRNNSRGPFKKKSRKGDHSL